ncbi:MAG TPA: site-specific integrase [Terriglobales bacterium]|nr:site-specific integrase [Terriglobales bacterium]
MAAKGWFRKKKGKLVFCWYNANGDERSKVVGLATMTENEGWAKIGELGLNTLVDKPDPTKTTFGEVLQRYLAYGKNKTGGDKAASTKKTNKKNASHLNYWSERIAKDIEPVEIQEWLDGQSKGLRSPLRNLMSAVYHHGQKFGMIPRKEECNPIKWVSATTVTDYEAVSLSPEESFAILEGITDPLVRVLVVVVAVTATRIGEALGLMWSDIDWKKLKINIRRDWVYGELGPPKSLASKAPVEMHETLAALLQAWRQQTPYSADSDFVFASAKLHGKKPRLGSMIVQDYVRPAAIAAGVITEDCPRFGFHNLRHGLSTFLIGSGRDPVVVQRMLRQSDVSMTMHYVHNRSQAREAQGQYLGAFLPNAGDRKLLSGGLCGGVEVVSELASAVE